MSYAKQVEQIVMLIKKNPRFFVLTGAGVSTESGIPDFRTPGKGVWEKVDPMQTATVQVLMNDPELFYKVGFSRFISYLDAEPNTGHYALAEMEEKGYLKGLITQNIDGLHVKAGNKKVWEVHGHLRTCHCTVCKQQHLFDSIVRQLAESESVPRCDFCNNMLRPDVVLFGDQMSVAFFEAERELRRGCDLMLVAGSSLQVYPVAALPEIAKKLVIINLEPTGHDSQTEVVVQEKCGKVLADIVALLP